MGAVIINEATDKKRKETWQKPRHGKKKERLSLQPEDGSLFWEILRRTLRRRKAVQLLRKASRWRQKEAASGPLREGAGQAAVVGGLLVGMGSM